MKVAERAESTRDGGLQHMAIRDQLAQLKAVMGTLYIGAEDVELSSLPWSPPLQRLARFIPDDKLVSTSCSLRAEAKPHYSGAREIAARITIEVLLVGQSFCGETPRCPVPVPHLELLPMKKYKADQHP